MAVAMFFRPAASGCAIAIGLALVAGCGAGGDGGPTSVTQAPADNSVAPVLPGAGGATNGPATPGGESNGFENVDLGSAPPAMGCQQASRTFVPNIPTVFILVDRSASMFDVNQQGTNAWSPLRTGVLQVISDLQADVRFGFGAFSGQGTTCPDMPMQAPAINNQPAIATLFNSLERSMYKDTPTVAAFTQAAQTLWADTTVEGEKYILFVTDGEPDYCDDGNSLCPPDSVVGKLQQLALGIDETGAQQTPIRTMVFGVNSPLTTISPEVLQAFANAGSGLPVAPVRQNANANYDPNAIYDQCNGVPGWARDFALTGKTAVRGQTIGDYIDPLDPLAVAGTAKVFRPDPNDQTALIGQIREALAGIKSCSFDLTGDVEVDLARTDLGTRAKIIVNGAAVPFDATNGWRMLNETTVALEGEACNMWRQPGETSIDFDFPCEVIVLR
jgi:hypothetical protein